MKPLSAAAIQGELHVTMRSLKAGAARLRALIDALDGGVTGAECSLAYDTITDAITRLEKAADELG